MPARMSSLIERVTVIISPTREYGSSTMAMATFALICKSVACLLCIVCAFNFGRAMFISCGNPVVSRETLHVVIDRFVFAGLQRVVQRQLARIAKLLEPR